MNTDKSPNRTSPPSLLSTGGNKPEEEGVNRILASLDGTNTPPAEPPAPSNTKKYLTFSLLGLFAAVGVSWFAIGKYKPAQTPIAAKPAQQQVAANTVPKPSVPVTPPLTSAEAPAPSKKVAELQPVEPAPAVITNEAPLAKTASAETAKKPKMLAEKTPQPTKSAVIPPASKVQVASAPAAKPQVASAPAAKIQIAMASPDELNAPMKMRGAAPTAAEPVLPKVIEGQTIYYSSNNTEVKSVASAPVPVKNKRDADVDMLTALMVYSERQDTLLSPPAPTPASTRGLSKKEIAERKKAPTTAALLSQCQSFGWLEGELCRIRVCENLRGIDPACPASQPAQASTLPPSQTVYTNKP